MEVRLLTENEFNNAQKLYCQSFNKENNSITIPLLGDLLGLFKDTELIGIAQIDYINNILENKKQAIINSFCIKNEYRHQGYGNFLLNECINYLKNKDIDKINVTSNKNRVYAHMLYKKNNFEIIDTVVLNKNLK